MTAIQEPARASMSIREEWEEGDRPEKPRDLVTLYAARASARAVDLRPVIGAIRAASPATVGPVRIRRTRERIVLGEPTPIGRGTAAHRHAVRGLQPAARRAGTAGAAWARPWDWVMRPGVRRKVATAGFAAAILLASAAGTTLAQQRYRVQPGDTIASIAATFGVDEAAILAASWVPDPANLSPGAVVVIPDPGQSPEEAAQTAAAREGTSPFVATAYLVQEGDTIAQIAARFGLDEGAVMEFNGVSDPYDLRIGRRLLIPPSRDDVGNAPAAAPAAGTFVTAVPTYVQQRNLSCEYAAAYIATAAWGYGVPESAFMERVPAARNPHYGFRGNIDGWWGNTDDYGVYPEPLAPVLREHGYVADIFYSFGDPAHLKWHLEQGHPVVTWLGFWGDTGVTLTDEDVYTVAAGAHVVVVYGYDDGGVYVSDPAKGDYDYYGWDHFLEMWRVLDGMTMAVYPA